MNRPLEAQSVHQQRNLYTHERQNRHSTNSIRCRTKVAAASRPQGLHPLINVMPLVAYFHSPSINSVKLHHRHTAITIIKHPLNLPQTEPRNSELTDMHSSKSNVTRGPSGNTRSAGKHQDFLNKPLTGRALKRAEKKQQELKKKAKEYFSKQ